MLAQQQTLHDIERKLRGQVAALVADAERDAIRTTELSASAIANSRIWAKLLMAVASLVFAT